MKDMGIYSIVVNKFRYYLEKTTTDEMENIFDRDFSTTGITQKWIADITYIHTMKDAWTYLATDMDLHSRKSLVTPMILP